MRARAAPPPEMPMAEVRGVVAFLLEDFGKGNFLGREAFFLPGRLTRLECLVVETGWHGVFHAFADAGAGGGTS